MQLDPASVYLHEAHGETVGVAPDDNACDIYDGSPMPEIELHRVDDAVARALLAGDDPGLPLGEGFPHADTFDGLRMRTPDARMFLVVAHDVVIGDCGTHGWVDSGGAVEIGYGLGEPWRGAGYGTAAVRALVQELRSETEVRELTAGVEIANEPSWRLLERLGFTVRDATETARKYALEL